MMVGKEDLGFSLSLSLGPLQHPPRHFRVDADGRAPAAAEREGEGDLQAGGRASSSSPSAVSSSGGKRDNEAGRACSGGPLSDEEDADGSRKKLRLSKDQSVVLEETFKEHNTLNPKQKLALAKKLKLRPRQVEVWFQNRRARTKLKQTEVDCELLKRCCEGLTEENRRLQKEVQELRALKTSPHLYAHNMTPPTTLTMCPSCERISSSSPAHPDDHHRRHRPMPPQMGGAGRLTPWAPIPLRPSFSQNS